MSLLELPLSMTHMVFDVRYAKNQHDVRINDYGKRQYLLRRLTGHTCGFGTVAEVNPEVMLSLLK
jgi:hypothetical protein